MTLSPLSLGINIDHIATLRNVRGTAYPDPLLFALKAEAAGADAITLHLREDRRHIRDQDVFLIRKKIKVRMNLEIALTEEMISFACDIKPSTVCLVPERRAELTTEGGLDVIACQNHILTALPRLRASGIRTILFVAADKTQIDAALRCGVEAIELHTGHYANANDTEKLLIVQHIQQSAHYAQKQGLQVLAGHGLHHQNVSEVAKIPSISELNIGHAIVARALDIGWHNAIVEIKSAMQQARNFYMPSK